MYVSDLALRLSALAILCTISPSIALPQNLNAAGSPDADGKYTLTAPGIRAQFIPYGASITNLFINDTFGIERDIVLGFDNASYYSEDLSHPHLNGVPGRYANRIRNGTFELVDAEGKSEKFEVVKNENLKTGGNTLQ